MVFHTCFLRVLLCISNLIVILSSGFQALPRGCPLQAVRPRLVVLLVPTIDAARALTITTSLSLEFSPQHQQVAMKKVSAWIFLHSQFFWVVALFRGNCIFHWVPEVVRLSQSGKWLFAKTNPYRTLTGCLLLHTSKISDAFSE